jgi:hypothetical protein
MPKFKIIVERSRIHYDHAECTIEAANSANAYLRATRLVDDNKKMDQLSWLEDFSSDETAYAVGDLYPLPDEPDAKPAPATKRPRKKGISCNVTPTSKKSRTKKASARAKTKSPC